MVEPKFAETLVDLIVDDLDRQAAFIEEEFEVFQGSGSAGVELFNWFTFRAEQVSLSVRWLLDQKTFTAEQVAQCESAVQRVRDQLHRKAGFSG